MNKIPVILIIFLFFNGCSLKSTPKLWEKKGAKVEEKTTITKIFDKIFIDEKELNSDVKIPVSKGRYSRIIFKNRNDTGEYNYDGNLEKIAKFKFSKFNDFELVDAKPLLFENKLVFFDNKGTILFFDGDQKKIWRENFYNKAEKKLKPRLSLAKKNNILIIADDIGKYYSVNLETGKTIWQKNNIVPFYSDIKIHENVFFVVDYKNILRCISIIDGAELWNFKTEESLTKSNTKLSVIFDKQNVYFNNSIGDITAVNLKSGNLVWQLPTQKNNITNNAFLLSSSNLVLNYNSILFSNNRSEFYSIDTETGSINWKNEIDSNLKPVVIDKFIITISRKGYLYLIEKQSGNIVRINDLYKEYSEKKRNKIKPTGFVVAKGKIYLSNDNGHLFIVDLNSGNILRKKKIANSKILEPLIHKNNIFLIKNGSIIKFN